MPTLGFPMVDAHKFPDFRALVEYGHAAGVKMGWYLNGCACGEREERRANYVGDVQRLHEYGFDAVSTHARSDPATAQIAHTDLLQMRWSLYTS